MAMADRKKTESEKPFVGKNVYFSNSMQGIQNQEKDFGYNVVQYLLENGANVLDQHVGGRDQDERDRLFLVDNGFELNRSDNPWVAVEQADVKLVDKASHVIAFVDGASHGVGSEVQRAIDLYEFGINKKEILCLIQEDRFKDLSWMVRGKESHKYPNFHLETYKDLEDAKIKVFNFLAMH
jgi:hypothetical protein